MKSFFASLAAAVLGLASLSQAHMEMKSPAPLRSKFNTFSTDVDYDMTAPLAAGGGNFPCKGYHKLLGTPQGKPVAEWVPGQSYNMTITGGAAHGGGSCQASISLDKGATWKVIHSYIGHCPALGESSYQFTLPGDTPAGDMLFAWTWFNQIGNREMYMNCAAITVKGGSKKRRGVSSPLASRPNIFVGNVGNGCGTSEGHDVMFPSPGPDVDMKSQQTAPPTGSCPSKNEGPQDGTQPGGIGDGTQTLQPTGISKSEPTPNAGGACSVVHSGAIRNVPSLGA